MGTEVRPLGAGGRFRSCMGKRTFLKLLAAGWGIFVAAVLGVPAVLMSLTPVARKRSGPVWRPIGRLDEFPSGDMSKAIVALPVFDWARSLKVKAVYVLRSTPDSLVVFSRNCTDLSCPIVWDPGSQCFFCPCHGGIFSRSGEPMAGPPKRPLYRYAHRIEDGIVLIDLNSLPPVT